MPDEQSLKRLGGGRWETRDGRFTIEPQSGTWVVVDNTQTDDLGLPRVRGPFGSLTAAKEAIGSARAAAPAESPLAERMKQARAGSAKLDGGLGTTERTATGRRAAAETGDERRTARPEPPAPPPEPKWLTDLEPADRRRARELIERLRESDIPDSESIARAEIARDQPALVRRALERAIGRAIASSSNAGEAGRAVVAAILRGKDGDLGVRWRLVDDRGRRIDELDIAD
jgi:hypothetical protein